MAWPLAEKVDRDPHVLPALGLEVKTWTQAKLRSSRILLAHFRIVPAAHTPLLYLRARKPSWMELSLAKTCCCPRTVPSQTSRRALPGLSQTLTPPFFLVYHVAHLRGFTSRCDGSPASRAIAPLSS